jgi:hypothetical protein
MRDFPVLIFLEFAGACAMGLWAPAIEVVGVLHGRMDVNRHP